MYITSGKYIMHPQDGYLNKKISARKLNNCLKNNTFYVLKSYCNNDIYG